MNKNKISITIECELNCIIIPETKAFVFHEKNVPFVNLLKKFREGGVGAFLGLKKRRRINHTEYTVEGFMPSHFLTLGSP
jgi:hypothetical protein